MPENEPWFIVDRARALAIVLLTRSEGLIVHEEPKDRALDLLVEIPRNRRQPMRRFGVVLKGAMSATDEEGANRILGPTVQGFLQSEPPALPTCLFFFTMEDDQGYYTWLTEPIIRENGRPLLGIHDAARCKKLATVAVKQIVRQVNEWYDDFFASLPEES